LGEAAKKVERGEWKEGKLSAEYLTPLDLETSLPGGQAGSG
jgi:hypothetical protein